MSNVVDLGRVLTAVQEAVDEYQNISGFDLPPLTSATFDFKTTIVTVAGLTLNLFIFKLGGSREDDVVTDVQFNYAPKAKPRLIGKRQKIVQPIPLTNALSEAIQSAAAALVNAQVLGSLVFNKLTVKIQYAVKWDGNVAATAPLEFVTVGFNVDKNKNATQAVTLVFG